MVSIPTFLFSKPQPAQTGEKFSRKWVWWITLLSWMVFSCVLVYWLLHFFREFESPMSDAVSLNAHEPIQRSGTEELQAALGVSKSDVSMRATDPNAVLSARLRLTGIVFESSKHLGSTHSIALLSLDQKPPKPYRVGMSLEPGLLVLSISEGQVNLGPELNAAPSLSLALPKTHLP